MTGYERQQMAEQAHFMRTIGQPGFAEELEQHLSDLMDFDYARHVADEAERQIAEHHKRHPWPGAAE